MINGKMIQFDKYVSRGLKPPTRKHVQACDGIIHFYRGLKSWERQMKPAGKTRFVCSDLWRIGPLLLFTTSINTKKSKKQGGGTSTAMFHL